MEKHKSWWNRLSRELRAYYCRASNKVAGSSLDNFNPDSISDEMVKYLYENYKKF